MLRNVTCTSQLTSIRLPLAANRICADELDQPHRGTGIPMLGAARCAVAIVDIDIDIDIDIDMHIDIDI
jgi:hypothetical protein